MLGVLSVVYWHFSELRGHGDLRPYGLVQFLPLALVLLITLLFPSAFSKAYYIWGMLAAYATAKVLEVFGRAHLSRARYCQRAHAETSDSRGGSILPRFFQSRKAAQADVRVMSARMIAIPQPADGPR